MVVEEEEDVVLEVVVEASLLQHMLRVQTLHSFQSLHKTSGSLLFT